MRRTITTLMFLAMSGLAYAAHAADNWQYYAAGTSSYRISDDDDSQSSVANAGGQAQATGQERNALYVADNSAGSGVLQASFFDQGGGCCNNCGGNQCGCGNNNCCLSDCCNCDCTIGMVRLEWLGWFTRGRNAVPLATTSDPVDEATIGNPSTRILFGNDPIGTNLRNGGRITLSRLMGDGLTTITGRFWGIEDGSQTSFTSAPPQSVIGIPFFNAALGQEDAFLVAFPGLTFPGQLRVTAKNDLIGADAWGSRNWFSDGSLSVDILAGYQFTRLDDSLVLNSLSTSIDPLAVLPIGTAIGIRDAFRTRNQYHAGTLGVLARSYRGPITLEGLFKVGLGNMNQAVIVNGSTTLTPPGGPSSTTPGGILTQASNIGTQTHNHFCYSPEINLNLLYNINNNWRAMVGYSFLYWNQVVLAGNQIDRNVNLGQATGGPLVPQPRFSRTDFWVQGVSIGGDYRW